MKTNQTRTAVILSLVLTAFPFYVHAADFIVIVNKDNASAVDKATAARMFTGDMKSWGDGTPVTAVDLPEDNPVRASFSTDVIGKSVSNMKAFWAQNVFSGKALPPKQVASDDEVKKLVSSTKGGIGYIKPSSADASVRTVIK